MPRQYGGNSWQGLANFLKSYTVDVRPEWQSFLGDYSVDPYQKAVLDEVQRRGADTRGKALGEVAGMFGSAGRSGSGAMGRTVGDTSAEFVDREQGLMASLKGQDYSDFLNRKMGAMSKITDADMAGRANVTQGFGDKLRANAANLASRLQHEVGMAGIDLGWGGLNFDKYKYGDMAPYNKLNSIGGLFGNLSSLFGPQYTQGEGTQPGAGINPWMAGLSGAAGGAASGYGASGGKGGGGSPAAAPRTGWGDMPGAA